MQLTAVMRTEVTCRLAFAAGPVAVSAAGLLGALSGAVPPAPLTAAALEGCRARAHASDPRSAAVRDLDRLWALVLGTENSFALYVFCDESAATDLSRYVIPNRAPIQKLRSPVRPPACS